MSIWGILFNIVIQLGFFLTLYHLVEFISIQFKLNRLFEETPSWGNTQQLNALNRKMGSVAVKGTISIALFVIPLAVLVYGYPELMKEWLW